ncbi:MAG: S-methyl-5'-thioinosine phosphorylase [Armatimonadota bacterium]|nr:MAG: S-methyl-5'-thioinosine phosphorylase [Armatimonadota bacterium]
MQVRFGIIGGTGLYSLGGEAEERQIETRYGAATVDVISLADQEVAFVPRHGRDHDIPPHLVNYRANIAALNSLGVTRILASAAVGSLNTVMQPSDFALPVQFIDFTRTRGSTFFDGSAPLRHTDMTEPYCPRLRAALHRAGTFLGDALHPAAVYVCTEGPRFETPAEIEMFARLGGDIVGMTGVPEAPLARELGICYASLAVVTNWAAGVEQTPLDHEAIASQMSERMDAVRRVFTSVIEAWEERPCPNCAASTSRNA